MEDSTKGLKNEKMQKTLHIARFSNHVYEVVQGTS